MNNSLISCCPTSLVRQNIPKYPNSLYSNATSNTHKHAFHLNETTLQRKEHSNNTAEFLWWNPIDVLVILPAKICFLCQWKYIFLEVCQSFALKLMDEHIGVLHVNIYIYIYYIKRIEIDSTGIMRPMNKFENPLRIHFDLAGGCNIKNMHQIGQSYSIILYEYGQI